MMTNKKENKEQETKQSEKKTCFVIMPIADVLGYDKGHFNRVYEEIIKPACEKAGYKPNRADDSNSSHHIMVDILTKIVKTDMVLCDVSSKNGNVLYELGVRQAFNKKTVIIKDERTESLFDINSLRYAGYDSSLRIDKAKLNIDSIAKSLQETENARGDEINSLISLLNISPAEMPAPTDMSADTKLILSELRKINARVSSLESHGEHRANLSTGDPYGLKATRDLENTFLELTKMANTEAANNSVLKHLASGRRLSDSSDN